MSSTLRDIAVIVVLTVLTFGNVLFHDFTGDDEIKIPQFNNEVQHLRA